MTVAQMTSIAHRTVTTIIARVPLVDVNGVTGAVDGLTRPYLALGIQVAAIDVSACADLELGDAEIIKGAFIDVVARHVGQ